MKIAYLSSYTADPIIKTLEKEAARETLSLQCHLAPFNQYHREIFLKSSETSRFKPDVLILSLQPEEFLNKQHDILGLVKTCSKNFNKSTILVHNCVQFLPRPLKLFESNNVESERMKIININLELVKIAKQLKNVFVLDLEGLALQYGIERIFDSRFHYLAKIPFSRFGTQIVTDQIIQALIALQGRRKKCLVLDLDGVLWGGVLGEDGIEKIVLSNDGEGKAYFDFQKGIKDLFDKGTILAICSKNNKSLALKAIRGHPHMVLEEKHFGSLRINWQDKATNIRAISDELNIGLDSLVFLDDTPFERELVRKLIPQVTVPDLPVDPAKYPAFLANLSDFDTFTITSEDAHRGLLYSQERQRKELQTKSGNFQSFLKSLNIKVKIEPANSWSIPRIAQLTQKTNQFNLSLKRYSEVEIKSLSKDPKFRVLSVSASDNLGDMGIIGVGIWEKKLPVGRLNTFLLSCRVLGRGIEMALLASIIAEMTKAKIKRIEAPHVPTDKNKIVARFFEKLKFHRQGNIFTLSATNVIKIPPWIKKQ